MSIKRSSRNHQGTRGLDNFSKNIGRSARTGAKGNLFVTSQIYRRIKGKGYEKKGECWNSIEPFFFYLLL